MIDRVLLLSMPFGALDRPSLGLGLLHAMCARARVACDTDYRTFRFAEMIGARDYQWVMDLPHTAFAGEWLFAEALYGRREDADDRYFDEVLRRTWRLGDAEVRRLLRIRTAVEPFLEESVHAVHRYAPTLVGLTSVFHQHLPSLALAARIRRSRPAVTVAFGGANCEGEMGVALQRTFPFVDLVFSGEAERSFPAVLRARAAGRPVTGIPGVTVAGSTAGTGAPAPPIADLDEVPVPSFDPYFAQLSRTPADPTIRPTLPLETSRGCWWGARAHCTFCGLNGGTMAFRSKSPPRVLDEIAALRSRHGITEFAVVDNILDSRYFRTVLPELAAAGLNVRLFWEVKATLTRAQVRLLRDAGVTSVQPGIESFSNHVLTLMRKGTTAARNIELLKWCAEYGVRPLWNLMYGLPGETAEDYREITELLPALRHLEPPAGYGPVRMDRFSPYFERPGEWGLTGVQPMAVFHHLYPDAGDEVRRIAYYFDFDYPDGRAADAYARDTIAAVLAWRSEPDRGVLAMSGGDDGSIRIADSRYGAAAPVWTVLTGWRAAVYRHCDRSQRLAALAALPEVRAAGVDAGTLLAFLERCAAKRSMARLGPRWLSLAVHVPPREPGGDQEPSDPSASAVLST
ncbi:RiPP maturation radical SAM C-methyltransferase [Streptomyces sp. AS02]|uniref:RiPP maturation radical SAM C-methyltransferase n=1 Tax=Streptomyces sp. AS02 TaxID=2938946 RepID=UPI002021ED0F|nr:RiPP maturation radical SAM C-methyltransferase [Streptomyces sp. AS02]MCL8015889.1 RiPP maturation radical SAM C-methyltransferase [Streptomyces sp. AS02]